MADHRLGAVSAELADTDGVSRVRLTLHEPEWSLPATIHAVECAAPGTRPGRTVYRRLRWPAPVERE